MARADGSDDYAIAVSKDDDFEEHLMKAPAPLNSVDT